MREHADPNQFPPTLQEDSSFSLVLSIHPRQSQERKAKTRGEKLLLKRKGRTAAIMPQGEWGLPAALGQLGSYWVPSRSLSLLILATIL